MFLPEYVGVGKTTAAEAEAVEAGVGVLLEEMGGGPKR